MRIFFLLFFLFSFCPVFGQQESFRDVDSLLKMLDKAGSDTSRVLLKCKLGEAYRANNPDTSFLLATEALKDAKALDYKKGEAHALITLCVLYREKGDLSYALQLGLNALKISEEEGLAYEEIFSLIRLGIVYASVRDIPLSRSYFRKAELKLEKNYDDFQWSVTRFFIADSYEQEDKLDSAENIVLKLEKVKGFEPTWVVICNRLLGHIALKRNQFQDAITYYRMSLAAAVAGNAIREAATTTIAMAQVFQKINQPDSAIAYAKQGLQWGESLGYRTRILSASNLLASIYADKDPVEAVKYFRMASSANDSIYGIRKAQQMQSATMREQVRQKELEAEKLAYRNRVKQFAFLAGAGVLFLLALLLYRNNRSKQKANTQIKKAYDELKNTQAQLIQSEKMASLGELTAGIAHEIQNPLNFVNNFSEVNRELIDEMNEQLAKGNLQGAKEIGMDIKENEEKINQHGKRADGIVKNMLLHSGKGSGKKESIDINALADEYLRLAYHGMRARDNSFNAKLETEFDPAIKKLDMIPQDIGRVLLNLVNNALFAVDQKRKSVAGDYEPIVKISSELKNNRVLIRVRDNGTGIPEKIRDKIFQPFFTTKAPGDGTGLGLSLSYDTIKAHGGEIAVNSKEGEGTEFSIQLPA